MEWCVAVEVLRGNVGAGFEKTVDGFGLLDGNGDHQWGKAVEIAGFEISSLLQERVNPLHVAAIGGNVKSGLIKLAGGENVVSGLGHRE